MFFYRMTYFIRPGKYWCWKRRKVIVARRNDYYIVDTYRFKYIFCVYEHLSLIITIDNIMVRGVLIVRASSYSDILFKSNQLCPISLTDNCYFTNDIFFWATAALNYVILVNLQYAAYDIIHSGQLFMEGWAK